MKPYDTKLGTMLKEFNFISDEQLNEALEIQKTKQKDLRLGEILVDLGYLDENDLIQVLEFQMGVPHADLKKYALDPSLANLLPENLARRHLAVPLELNGNKLRVALADPANVVALDDIRKVTKYSIEPLIASQKEIKRAISRLYISSGTKAEEVMQILESQEVAVEDEPILIADVDDEVEDAPVVRLANLVINQAIQERASDIHVEPWAEQVKVRYRVDGILIDRMTVPKANQAALLSRLKIMANLDISERRKPQDGRINIKRGEIEWDMRVSTLPTMYGEKMAIRILDRMAIPSLDSLGFTEENEAIIRAAIKNPHGIFLVTGPTGSGKSTTLFSALKELNKPQVNITTVEDPIEYVLPGVNQVQANPRIGVTFANVLRSMLRQDPDIIMVGEIRDNETAGIAVNAALTGHLVVSTLHTNDAPSAVTRLVEMDVEPFLVGTTVIGIMAQRLVRRVCPNCRKKVELSEDEKIFLANNNFSLDFQYTGAGCSRCNYSGYRGRMGVHEILTMNRQLRQLTSKNANAEQIRDAALQDGMKTLLMDGLEKVRGGFTSLEEVLKVAAAQ